VLLELMLSDMCFFFLKKLIELMLMVI
jgi:hypothetical protein